MINIFFSGSSFQRQNCQHYFTGRVVLENYCFTIAIWALICPVISSILRASQEHMFTSLLSCLWRPLDDASWTLLVSVPADNCKSFVADISRLFEKLLTRESTPEMRASCVNFHSWNYFFFKFWQVHGPFTVSIGHIVRFFQRYFENRLLKKLVRCNVTDLVFFEFIMRRIILVEELDWSEMLFGIVFKRSTVVAHKANSVHFNFNETAVPPPHWSLKL